MLLNILYEVFQLFGTSSSTEGLRFQDFHFVRDITAIEIPTNDFLYKRQFVWIMQFKASDMAIISPITSVNRFVV